MSQQLMDKIEHLTIAQIIKEATERIAKRIVNDSLAEQQILLQKQENQEYQKQINGHSLDGKCEFVVME